MPRNTSTGQPAQPPLIGAHVDSGDPVPAARARGAEAMQFFLADPQGWKEPVRHEHFDDIRDSGLSVYIHSPYVINVATSNNRIRIPSRKLLGQHAAAAAEIGARGLIVHGGHVNAGDDPAVGLDNWRKTFARAADEGGFPLPDPHREHRGREQRDGPPLRPAGDAVGCGRRVRRRLLPRHLPCPRRRRGSRRHRRPGASRSPVASTSSTPTTAATRSTPAPTATRTSDSGEIDADDRRGLPGGRIRRDRRDAGPRGSGRRHRLPARRHLGCQRLIALSPLRRAGRRTARESRPRRRSSRRPDRRHRQRARRPAPGATSRG